MPTLIISSGCGKINIIYKGLFSNKVVLIRFVIGFVFESRKTGGFFLFQKKFQMGEIEARIANNIYYTNKLLVTSEEIIKTTSVYLRISRPGTFQT